ncbi:hypothetical protein [Balneatrix alpica]|uniref:Porin n=1 Tax=Balneatrix alpica TaxID=75684 RepID=A0ABV5ZDF8_9GAMM|nr:hypothetical protein [Balneatrix alpica]
MNKWLVAGLLALPGLAQAEFELSGKVGTELRLFTESAQFSGQQGTANLSVFARPELYWSWNEGADALTFVPYVRLDQHDPERSHVDIRELSWVHVGDEWEVRAGLRKVFWGVTEFQHLVDTLNQSDQVEDLDGEDKLGQPMLNLSRVTDYGIIDAYLLPGFRERTFPGVKGRLRTGLLVDTDLTSYESGAEDKHVDLALRWSNSIGPFDLGVHWFKGTQRDPLLQAKTNGNGQLVLAPHYLQVEQVGVDAQATLGSWLWKLETLYRDSSQANWWAAQAGFEYTFYGVMDSAADVGVLLEYGWDQRGEKGGALAQRDLYLGSRIALNDEDSSEFLGGVSYDLDYHSKSLMLEASTRLDANWKVSLEGRFFSVSDQADPAYNLRKDDHLQLTLERFF